MYILRQRQRFPILNIKNLLSILKKNHLLIILTIFICWSFYQIHLDAVKHASEKYISLSGAWKILNSNMNLMAESCQEAHKSNAKAN